MARTGGSKKNEPFAIRSTPAQSGLMKLKPKTKIKSNWKPLDLSESDNPESFTAVDAETSQDEGEASPVASPSEIFAPVRAPRGPPIEMAGSTAGNEKDEIMEEFGHNLPDPVWLSSNMGKQNGELRFIQHPNREVSAHSWSSDDYEWVELGRYSRIRKVIEGKVMALEFLQHVRASKSRQPSLSYFAELAKEYPRYCEARPAVIMPPLSSLRPANVVQQRPSPLSKPPPPELTRYDSLSTISTSLNENEFPTLSTLTLRDRPVAWLNKPVTTVRSGITPQGLGTPADDPFAAESSNPSKKDSQIAQTSDAVPKHIDKRDPGKMDFDFRFPLGANLGPRLDAVPNTRENNPKAFFSEQERNRAERMRQNFAPPEHPFHEATNPAKADDTPLSAILDVMSRYPLGPDPSAPVVHQGLTNVAFPGHVFTAAPTAKVSAPSTEIPQVQFPQQPNENRARMLDYLNRVGTEQPPPLGSPHDLRFLQRPEPANRGISSSGQMAPHDMPASSGSQTSRSALRTSDPEPEYSENRPTSIYSSLGIDGPSPQEFDGPFFQDNMPTQSNPTALRSAHKSRGEDLDEWWKSGTLPERQDAFAKSLISPMAAGAGKDDKDFMVTGPLLVRLYENLASYVHLPGEPQKGPDHFARFAPPPEWAIDRSRDGDKSFFGEDWGETPRRIGRDPRYRPTFGQHRYTLYEDACEEPAIRFPSGMRPSPAGPSYAGGNTGGLSYTAGNAGGSNFLGGTFGGFKYPVDATPGKLNNYTSGNPGTSGYNGGNTGGQNYSSGKPSVTEFSGGYFMPPKY